MDNHTNISKTVGTNGLRHGIKCIEQKKQLQK